MINKAVFLDRDGTINIDFGYVKSPNEVQLFENVGKALNILQNELGFKLIVISNQSGVSRGYMTVKDVDEVNKKVNDFLRNDKVSIDAFYYCPFHPEIDGEKLAKARKPSPEMVLNAARDFNIDLSKSYFIGDMLSDMECANNAGVAKSIFVKTSKHDEFPNIKKRPELKIDYIAESLFEAANYIKLNTL